LHDRLRASVRTIPGTETQYLIGGYLQLDGIATRKKQDGATATNLRLQVSVRYLIF
jgi:hypothetical protein